MCSRFVRRLGSVRIVCWWLDLWLGVVPVYSRVQTELLPQEERWMWVCLPGINPEERVFFVY